MRKLILPTMTDSELNMLNGFLGQLSDGAGENLNWTTKYWSNMEKFENVNGQTYININDQVKPFKNKTDSQILEDLCERFITIADDVYSVCGMTTMHSDEKDLDEPQAILDANSIVEKLSGEKDHWEPLDAEEYQKMCQENEEKMNRVNQLLMEDINRLNDLAANLDKNLDNPNYISTSDTHYEEIEKLLSEMRPF